MINQPTNSVTAICSAFAESAPASTSPTSHPPEAGAVFRNSFEPDADVGNTKLMAGPPPAKAGARDVSASGSIEMVPFARDRQAVVASRSSRDEAATATTLSRMKKARTFDARTSIAITDSSYSIAA